MDKKDFETAVFGGGCFWCTEAIFKSLRGVFEVTPGYAGGTTKNPTYYDLHEAETGHAEVIKIKFDPKVIPYSVLLDIFWHTHNPTTPNMQGNDRGTEYRSIILYTSPEQKKQAEEALAKLQKSGEFSSPIVTEIQPLIIFYEAESYHKDYYNKNQNAPYCELVINPKLQHLRELYSDKLK